MATETTAEREAADKRGIDGLTRRIVAHGEESRRPVSHEAARREAVRIAELTDRQRRK